MELYYNVLYHSGETRTELSISQHFYLKNLCKTVHEICTKYKTCQFRKGNKKQFGKLPPKEEIILLNTLCLDIIGKYQFTPKGGGKQSQILPKGDEKKYKMSTKSGKSVYLQAVAMIGPVTGCKEIRTVPSALADFVANQVELAWLMCYPLPYKEKVDRVNEFLAKFLWK